MKDDVHFMDLIMPPLYVLIFDNNIIVENEICVYYYTYVTSRVIDHDSKISSNNTPANQDR